MTNAEAVRQFMLAYNQTVNAVPTGVVPGEVQELRVELIREELDELIEAMADRDVVGIADALADILYVTYGAAHVYGIPIDKVFAEVHRSNMTKLGSDGRPVYREDGKVVKGPDYEPPNIVEILASAWDTAGAGCDW